MPLIINKEPPRTVLVTMGKADKEVQVDKETEPTYETHPELYYYPSGATEPVLKPGATVTSGEAESELDELGDDEDEKSTPKSSAKAPSKKVTTKKK